MRFIYDVKLVQTVVLDAVTQLTLANGGSDSGSVMCERCGSQLFVSVYKKNSLGPFTVSFRESQYTQCTTAQPVTSLSPPNSPVIEKHVQK